MMFADELRHGRFFFGGDLGAAQMDLQRGDVKYNSTWLYGALRAEYALSDQLLLGMEGAGWTDQKDVDSSISEDVLAFMMTARVYPLLESGAFVKAGWGYVKHRYWESSVLSIDIGNHLRQVILQERVTLLVWGMSFIQDLCLCHTVVVTWIRKPTKR